MQAVRPAELLEDHEGSVELPSSWQAGCACVHACAHGSAACDNATCRHHSSCALQQTSLKSRNNVQPCNLAAPRQALKSTAVKAPNMACSESRTVRLFVPGHQDTRTLRRQGSKCASLQLLQGRTPHDLCLLQGCDIAVGSLATLLTLAQPALSRPGLKVQVHNLRLNCWTGVQQKVLKNQRKRNTPVLTSIAADCQPWVAA